MDSIIHQKQVRNQYFLTCLFSQNDLKTENIQKNIFFSYSL